MATQRSVFQFCSNWKPESPSNFQNFLSILKGKLYDLLHEVKLVGGGVGLKAGVLFNCRDTESRIRVLYQRRFCLKCPVGKILYIEENGKESVLLECRDMQRKRRKRRMWIESHELSIEFIVWWGSVRCRNCFHQCFETQNEAKDSPDSSSKISDVKDFQGEGYRLVDLKKLYATLSEAHVCEEGEKTCKWTSVLVLTFSLLFMSCSIC